MRMLAIASVTFEIWVKSMPAFAIPHEMKFTVSLV
jgi:hypothetical protein